MIEKTSSDLKKEEKLKIKSRRSSPSASQGKESFRTSLDDAIKFHFDGTFDELLDDLKDQEKRFLESQTIYELNRYKAVVKKILSMILDDGMETKTLKRYRKDRSDFTIVDKINEKLMEISEAVIRNNKAFNLLKTIEEIRGLILDLRF